MKWFCPNVNCEPMPTLVRMTPETKASMKKPGDNPWNDFQATHRNKGYSPDQLRAMYHQQKAALNVRPKATSAASSSSQGSQPTEASSVPSAPPPRVYAGPDSSPDALRSKNVPAAKAKAMAKAPQPPGHDPTTFAQTDVFDVNQVTELQLKSISGIGDLLAKNFLAKRKELKDKGFAFVSVKQLKLVKGIGDETFEATQHRFTVGS